MTGADAFAAGLLEREYRALPNTLKWRSTVNRCPPCGAHWMTARGVVSIACPACGYRFPHYQSALYQWGQRKIA